MTTATHPPLAGAGAALTARQQRVQALTRGEPADLEQVAADLEHTAQDLVVALSAIQAHAEELRAHDFSGERGEAQLATLALSIQALAEVAALDARAIQAHAARRRA